MTALVLEVLSDPRRLTHCKNDLFKMCLEREMARWAELDCRVWDVSAEGLSFFCGKAGLWPLALCPRRGLQRAALRFWAI